MASHVHVQVHPEAIDDVSSPSISPLKKRAKVKRTRENAMASTATPTSQSETLRASSPALKYQLQDTIGDANERARVAGGRTRPRQGDTKETTIGEFSTMVISCSHICNEYGRMCA